MANRNSNLREKYLDAELLFRRYWEMGEGRTIRLLTEWAITQGMTSSRGDKPTEMGVWKAMWRWASLKENQSLAWSIVNKHKDMSYKNWEWDMKNVKIPSAWQHTTSAKREKFMRENGWL
jgi:hypothetical protein